eukprot:TRINITY_DN4862_c0_g1_i1.p1 TRINITY_DN4862_c0_g1~~TRINITY_DN4862_c0_g1_i1.p1  ORF type:complete len:320 (+),score=66.87 TRINITY_DN4862_c0_g1_i1:3-962(+)
MGYFDKPILSLPPKLIQLSFGYSFSHILPHPLPSTLKQLDFGFHYAHTIVYPPQLTRLSLSGCQPITNNLPKQLTHLTVQYYNNEVLPDSLTHLTIQERIANPPETFNINPPPPHDNLSKAINITHLHTGSSHLFPIHHFPPKLTHLTTYKYFNEKLPSTLTNLKIDVLPYLHYNLTNSSITHLQLKLREHNPTPINFPLSLTHLVFESHLPWYYDFFALKHLVYLRFGLRTNLIQREIIPESFNLIKVTKNDDEFLVFTFSKFADLDEIVNRSLYSEYLQWETEGSAKEQTEKEEKDKEEQKQEEEEEGEEKVEEEEN